MHYCYWRSQQASNKWSTDICCCESDVVANNSNPVRIRLPYRNRGGCGACNQLLVCRLISNIICSKQLCDEGLWSQHYEWVSRCFPCMTRRPWVHTYIRGGGWWVSSRKQQLVPDWLVFQKRLPLKQIQHYLLVPCFSWFDGWGVVNHRYMASFFSCTRVSVTQNILHKENNGFIFNVCNLSYLFI